MVTGPSLCISTSISAPNSPVCTFTPLAAVMALNSSYRREASPGSAAPLKLGRLPWRQEAYSVNCDMESTLPPTSSKLKFILPASSSKTRRFSILSAMGAKTLLSSFGPKPTSATKPQPMLPLIFPSMATLPFLTRCKTNFIINLRRCR